MDLMSASMDEINSGNIPQQEQEYSELPDWDVNPHSQASSTAHLALRNHVENLFTSCKQENIHLPSELCHNLLKLTSSMPPIRIGFVGETGVGKSTIIDRLLGVNLLKSPAFGFGKNTPSSKLIVELLPHADIDRQDYLFDFVIVAPETIHEWHHKAKADAQYWREHADEEAPHFLRWFLRCFTNEEVSYKPSPSFAFEDHYNEELPKYQEFLEYYARESSSFTKVTPDLYQTVFEDAKRFSPFIQQVSVFGPFHLLRALHVTLVDIPGTGFGIPPMAAGEGGSWLMEERGRLAARMCQDIFFVADHRLTSSTASERSLLSLAMKCRNLYLIRTHASGLIHHVQGQGKSHGQPSGGEGERANKYGPDAVNRRLMEDLRHIHQHDQESSGGGYSPFAHPSMKMLLDRIGTRIFAIENMEGDPMEGQEYDPHFDVYWQHFVDSLEIIYGNRFDRDVQRRVQELNCLFSMTRIPDTGEDMGESSERLREEERGLRDLCDSLSMEFSPPGITGEGESGDWLSMCFSSSANKGPQPPTKREGGGSGGAEGKQEGLGAYGPETSSECMLPMHLLSANHQEFNRRIASACGHSHKLLQSWLTFSAGYWQGEWRNSKMSELFETVLSCLLPLEPAFAGEFNQAIQQMIDFFVSKIIRPQLLASSRVLRDDKTLQTFILRRCKNRIVTDLLDCFQGVKFFFVHRVVPLLMERYGETLQDRLRKSGPGCKQAMLKGLRNWFSLESQSLVESVLPECIEKSLRVYFTEEVEKVRADVRACSMQISLCRSLIAHKQQSEQRKRVNAIFQDVDVEHLNLDLSCCRLMETRSVDLSPLFDEVTSRCPALLPVIDSLKEKPGAHMLQCPVKYSPHHQQGRDRDREGIHLSGIEHRDLLFTQKPMFDVRLRCGRVERLHDKSAAFSTVGGESKTSLYADRQRVFASWSTCDATLVEGIVHHCLFAKSLSRTSDYFNCSLDLVQNLTDCVVRFVDENHAFA